MLVGLESVDDFLKLPDHFWAHHVDRRVVDRDTPIGGRPAGHANLCGFRSCTCTCHGILLCACSLRNWLVAVNAFSSSGSFVTFWGFVKSCRACLANDLVLGICASRNSDCANDRAFLDQRNAAARRNDSIEREQIVEMHKVDTVLEDLGFASERRGGSCLVFCNLNGGKPPAAHPLESHPVAARIRLR